MIVALLLAAAQATTPVRPQVQRYTVDPARSVVGFDGSSSLHDFTGRTQDVRGELILRLRYPSLCANGRILALASSLDTDSSGRDEDMHELLEVDTHPDLMFRIDGAGTHSNDIDRAGPLPHHFGKTTVQGTFVVRGVELAQEVTVDVTCLADAALQIHGRQRVKMSSFGIKPPKVLFVKTADEVEVWWKLALVPVAAQSVPAQSYFLTVYWDIIGLDGGGSGGKRGERLWTTDRGSLWERYVPWRWHVASSEGTCAIDLARASKLAPAGSFETVFGEFAIALERARGELAAAPTEQREALAAKIERFENALALAPPNTTPEVIRGGGRDVEVRIGDTTWLEIRGPYEDGDFAALLATLDGLPPSVRDVLAGLDGVPNRVRVRRATPAGVETFSMERGLAEAGELPDWALAPSSWCGASTDE